MPLGVLHYIHVLVGEDRVWGYSPAVVETPLGRVGVNICLDAMPCGRRGQGSSTRSGFAGRNFTVCWPSRQA